MIAHCFLCVIGRSMIAGFKVPHIENLGVTNDEFEVMDWPKEFGWPYTPFKQAVDETFNDPQYSQVVLEF